MDLEDIETARDRLRFRGAQGTTGSQATFLELFKGWLHGIKEMIKGAIDPPWDLGLAELAL